MNTMDFYLWLMPVIFLVHEFEEIFMIEAWYERNKEKISAIWPQKKPFGLDNAGPYLSSSIAIGIFSEFLVAILICVLCVLFDNYYAWYGFFAGFVLHFIIRHFPDMLKFKGYFPGNITGAIVILPSIWILYQTAILLDYNLLEIVLSAVVMQLLLSFIVFRGLHKSMLTWSERLYKYAKGESTGS